MQLQFVFFFKQKTADEWRIGDWSSDVGSSDLIAAAIDKLFVNSPDETKSQSEKEFTQSFIKQFGDINFIVKAILGAVFFTLLFLTGNTMMQSVRERIPELAVLKTLGFTDAKVTARSEARRVGKEWGSTCRTRRSRCS